MVRSARTTNAFKERKGRLASTPFVFRKGHHICVSDTLVVFSTCASRRGASPCCCCFFTPSISDNAHAELPFCFSFAALRITCSTSACAFLPSAATRPGARRRTRTVAVRSEVACCRPEAAAARVAVVRRQLFVQHLYSRSAHKGATTSAPWRTAATTACTESSLMKGASASEHNCTVARRAGRRAEILQVFCKSKCIDHCRCCQSARAF